MGGNMFIVVGIMISTTAGSQTMLSVIVVYYQMNQNYLRR